MAEWIDYFRGLANVSRGNKGAFANDYIAFWDQTTNPEQPMLKMAMGLLEDEGGGYTIPGIVLGAGDSEGKNRAYIEKNMYGLDIFLRSSDDKVARVRLGNDGKVYVNETEFQVFSADNPIPSEYIAEAEAWNKKLAGLSYDSGTDFWYVPQSKLAPDVSAKLDSGAEAYSYFDLGVLHTQRLADAAVTTAKLADYAVDTPKLAALAVTAYNLQVGCVTTSKLAFAAVGAAAIGASAIGTAHICNGAIINAHIADATITSAKIADLEVEKLTGTYLTGKTVRTAGPSSTRVELGLGSGGGSIDFWYASSQMEKRASIYQSGGALFIEPQTNGSLCLGASGKYSYPKGYWDCSGATFSNLTDAYGYSYVTSNHNHDSRYYTESESDSRYARRYYSAQDIRIGYSYYSGSYHLEVYNGTTFLGSVTLV